MEFKHIIFKKEDRIATIILNRPEVLNAYNQPMSTELLKAVREVSDDDDIRVLVITGAGRAFCAGADFRYKKVREKQFEVEESEDMLGTIDEIFEGKILPKHAELRLMLQRMGKPTIAMVNGVAAAGGWDIASACDIRIGCPNTRFRVSYTLIAVPPDGGGTWFLPRLMGIGRALEYIFTGDFLEAEEAYRIGVLNRLVPAERLEEETMALARKLANGPPIAHRLAKIEVYKGLEMDLETALAFAYACVQPAKKSEDHLEGVRALVEKRPPKFKGIGEKVGRKKTT